MTMNQAMSDSWEADWSKDNQGGRCKWNSKKDGGIAYAHWEVLVQGTNKTMKKLGGSINL